MKRGSRRKKIIDDQILHSTGKKVLKASGESSDESSVEEYQDCLKICS